jgi:hypothetical protein
MTAMAEKMNEAGVDIIGARLTAACIEAIRSHPDSVVDVWRTVGASFGHEFVRALMNDMQPKVQTVEPRKAFDKIAAGLNEALAVASGIAEPSKLHIPAPKPYQPRVIPPERLEKRRELQQLIRSKYKNSGGVAWSEVGWHELHGVKRDGTEAKALLEAGPANVPNTGQTVGQVLGVQRVDEIIMSVRK